MNKTILKYHKSILLISNIDKKIIANITYK